MKKESLFAFVATIAVMLAVSSCEKDVTEIVISDDKQIDELMEEQSLTSFLTILDISGLRSTVHAYGNYALFAPTNEAVDMYLQQVNKASVTALTHEEAATIVKYHLLNISDKKDSLTTKDFVDGRMSYPNFAGTYLTTKQEGEDIRINRQAYIESPRDIKASNGYLHIIDQVLTPPDTLTESLTARVRALPETFSLFKEAFERSGLADLLATNKKGDWKTLFIQDNEAFATEGINTLNDLVTVLRANTPAIEDEDSLLRNFIGYHAVPRLVYVADLLAASSLETLVKNQVLTFSREFAATETRILLNELKLGQTTEAGIPLDRSSVYTDWTCSNGVIHKLNGNIQIKIRSAYRIYWDIAEQPEIMALRNFRKPGCAADYNPGDLSEITWEYKSGTPVAQQQIHYYCGTVPQTISAFDEKFQYIYGDYLRLNLDLGAIRWMEMVTPVLIGSETGTTYKVWICYRRELQCYVKTSFKQAGYDDQILPYIFDMSLYAPNDIYNQPEVAELDGWKMYNAKKYNSVVISKLLGTIKVYTTGRHILRLEPTTNRRVGQLGNIDMIQFIPIDEEQLWPRVDVKGNWVGPELKACEIWPLEECPVDTTNIE
ncbi:MAG: Fasciclin domain protein [Bacteroidetes bacterium ADurb.Bin416]|nr:MAG: Fasciclin domain protein [Bacteroidetes bacterium ADurb.Bin416]